MKIIDTGRAGYTIKHLIELYKFYSNATEFGDIEIDGAFVEVFEAIKNTVYYERKRLLECVIEVEDDE